MRKNNIRKGWKKVDCNCHHCFGHYRFKDSDFEVYWQEDKKIWILNRTTRTYTGGYTDVNSVMKFVEKYVSEKKK